MFRLIVAATFLGIINGKTIRPNLPPLEGRIVGGIDTTIEEHPYQLSLEILPLKGMHVCGASLLRPNVVLTAAHCTYPYKASDLRIRAGTTTRENGGETANVVSVCQHPNYKDFDSDVSVLILDRDLPLGSAIQTITLQPRDVDVAEGAEATVTGWGALYYGGPSPSTLQEVNVYRVGDISCNETYSVYGLSITENMICFDYAGGGKGACTRDSGGPLLVDGKQVGIVSFGIGCALPNSPTVYAKVASKNIMNHIDSCIANL